LVDIFRWVLRRNCLKHWFIKNNLDPALLGTVASPDLIYRRLIQDILRGENIVVRLEYEKHISDFNIGTLKPPK
jgi:hypothetical protein